MDEKEDAMKTYVTADLHFGHENIIKFCAPTRGHFKDADHMNEEMVRMWNEIVNPEDNVYILGDVAFMQAQKAAEMVNRLNGRKILIQGNHDVKTLRDPMFRMCFAEIHVYHEIDWRGTRVCMFHYPIAEFNQMHRGAVHFHGHLHGKPNGLEEYRVRDVGWDATGNIVTDMDDIFPEALKGKVKNHHPTT